MNPLKLLLTGFAGITSGLGKETIELDLTKIPSSSELIAIIAPNGTGKSTLMDNLHPYRVMPSRLNTSTSAPTPTSFSYYDHISATSAVKDLYWEHAGKFYRSLVNITAIGKTQKQEAFLFVLEDGSYIPYVSKLGVSSDGKAAVYDACVNEIMGPPEIFFMAGFSAQGKRSVSSMKAPEIKEILSAMLGTDNIKALSEKAVEVVKNLRPHLDALKTQALPAQHLAGKEGELVAKLGNAKLQLINHTASQSTAQAAVLRATENLGRVKASVDQQVSIAAQKESVSASIASTNQTSETYIASLKQQHQNSRATLEARSAEISESGNRSLDASKRLGEELITVQALAATHDAVQLKAKEAPMLLMRQSDLRASVETLTQEVQPLTTLRADARSLATKLATTTAEGASIKEAIQLAEATSALIGRVPCNGTAMQSACSLLAVANEAQQELPTQVEKRRILVVNYKETLGKSQFAENMILKLIDKEVLLKQTNDQLNVVQLKYLDAKNAASILTTIEAAKSRITMLDSQIADEVSRRRQIRVTSNQVKEELDALTARQQAEIDNSLAASKKTLDELNASLAKLPKLVSSTDIEDARYAVDSANVRVDALKAEAIELEREIGLLTSELQKAVEAKEFVSSVDSKCLQISDAMAIWTLLSKAFGNDGIIALSIDDAGPEISRIANRLLNDCYGGRFQIRMDTQKTTATGVLKETFEIMVQDTARGEDKSVSLMSGGEKVWINECLVRAFALYMANSSGLHYDTLFCDESDDGLDIERKRQFMTMKRAVLKAGGGKREFFITHTPELWNMADSVIDVALL